VVPATSGDSTEGAQARNSLNPWNVTSKSPTTSKPQQQPVASSSAASVDEMFANRLRKNQRALKGWQKQQNVSAYRLYDADIPEFAVAVDVYLTDKLNVVVQEYQAPSRVDDRKAERRLIFLYPTIAASDGDDTHRA